MSKAKNGTQRNAKTKMSPLDVERVIRNALLEVPPPDIRTGAAGGWSLPLPSHLATKRFRAALAVARLQRAIVSDGGASWMVAARVADASDCLLPSARTIAVAAEAAERRLADFREAYTAHLGSLGSRLHDEAKSRTPLFKKLSELASRRQS